MTNAKQMKNEWTNSAKKMDKTTIVLSIHWL